MKSCEIVRFRHPSPGKYGTRKISQKFTPNFNNSLGREKLHSALLQGGCSDILPIVGLVLICHAQLSHGLLCLCALWMAMACEARIRSSTFRLPAHDRAPNQENLAIPFQSPKIPFLTPAWDRFEMAVSGHLVSLRVGVSLFIGGVN